MAEIEKSIDFKSWIQAATSNPVEYRRRQAVEILLYAIGRSSDLRNILFMKGGTLMNIVHDSPRMTADVDFTTIATQSGFVDFMKSTLDPAMRSAAVNLGYPGLICRIQSSQMRPPEERFPWPTLRIKIGIALDGTSQARKLEVGRSVHVVGIDISFNERVFEPDTIFLSDDETTIFIYSLHDLIAEKLRAILQQPIRNRERGQDIYDISRLVEKYPLGQIDKGKILKFLIDKSRSREMTITKDSILDPEIAERCRRRYESLSLETDAKNLDFERDMVTVIEFYQALPWPK